MFSLMTYPLLLFKSVCVRVRARARERDNETCLMCRPLLIKVIIGIYKIIRIVSAQKFSADVQECKRERDSETCLMCRPCLLYTSRCV